MPRVEIVAADTPFHARLRSGFGYPLRGAALPTCVVLALIHYVGLLPGYIGALASALVWAATWRYAADCMQHTANGYADPPDVGSDGSSTSGWGLTAIHLCRGYLAHWRRDPQAPRYGLLATRQLGTHADQRTEAWPDHPLRMEIDAQRQQLASPA